MAMLRAVLGSVLIMPVVPAGLSVPLRRHRLPSNGPGAAARRLTVPMAETELTRPHEMPYDMAVVAEVLVGTPPQALRVLLDSGSGDFWLPSSDGGLGGRVLDGRASRTFAAVRRQSNGGFVMRKIRYGYGEIQSMVVQDTVRFAGVEVQQQSFLLATKQQFPSKHLWDGILGLAFPAPFPAFAGGGRPLLAELGRRGVAPVLSFLPGAGGRGAELRLGRGSYEGLAGHDITWVKSVSEKHWIVDAFVGVSHRKAQRMIIDTGTSLILVSPTDFMATAEALSVGQTCLLDKSATRVFCSCANVSAMPALRLRLNATVFVLGPEDLFERTGRPLGGEFHNEEACELLMSVIPVHREEWILGDVFLRKVVTVFDFERGMVGFAPLKDDPRVQHRTRSTGSTLTSEVQWLPDPNGMLSEAVDSNRSNDSAAKHLEQAWDTPDSAVSHSRIAAVSGVGRLRSGAVWRGFESFLAVLLLSLGAWRLRSGLRFSRWTRGQPATYSSATLVSETRPMYRETALSME